MLEVFEARQLVGQIISGQGKVNATNKKIVRKQFYLLTETISNLLVDNLRLSIDISELKNKNLELEFKLRNAPTVSFSDVVKSSTTRVKKPKEDVVIISKDPNLKDNLGVRESLSKELDPCRLDVGSNNLEKPEKAK